MLVVITITTMLATFVIIGFSKFNASQSVNKDAGRVVSLLGQARSLTLSSKNNSQYGIHFASGEMVLFKGNSYSESDDENVSILLNPHISLAPSLNDGGRDVVFQKLSGKTNDWGTITLSIRTSTSTSEKVITIFNSGVAESN